ncbi:MAG: acetoacetate--CoA ligase [Firmicutes bacterium]|nr:acetoacetate--CoA ligase [Bacillota bacterium]
MSDEEARILWSPSPDRQAHSRLAEWMAWLRRYGYTFSNYEDLWAWSTTELESFWDAVWHYFDLGDHGRGPVLTTRRMPGARWFQGSSVNYAEALLRQFTQPDRILAVSVDETGRRDVWRVGDFKRVVGALQAQFRAWGIGPGDRVAAYLPNVGETLAAFVATAGLGAIWSVASPDFGTPSVIDRFRQIAPRVLLVIDGYWYHGRYFDRREEGRRIAEGLPSVEHVIALSRHGPGDPWIQGGVSWDAVLGRKELPTFVPVEFSHPLWILYSSGTTGLPKAIAHSHGGMLLSHLVNAAFHMDLRPEHRFFWYTTTGWMMWNVVVSALLMGSQVVLYDGSPSYPSPERLWRLADDEELTFLGTSAAFLQQCMKLGVEPGRTCRLASLTTIGSTGSPLPPEAYDWVYRAVKSDVWLAPASGGTDVCGAFVGGSPLHPVRRGEMQCRALGAAVHAFDSDGQDLVEAVGELVITQPMPAMPLKFWGDESGARYRASYFSMYPGVWRHGDWIRITREGGAIIYGRSDSTINRYGVRMGSSEIYRAVESVPAVMDSLVVDLEGLHGRSFMPLFVKLREGAVWTPDLKAAILQAIRDHLSPRHLPDDVVVVADIPKTLNGKKLEVPIRKILAGTPVEEAVNPDAMMNPESLAPFVAYAAALREHL